MHLLIQFIFLSIVAFARPRVSETVFIGPVTLDRTPMARHVGEGDEELKRFATTHLTGSFIISIQNGKLLGKMNANFKETFIRPGNKVDDTEFVVEHTYILCEPKAGFKVTSYKILYDGSPVSEFDSWQRAMREQDDVPNNGPLGAITWVGDTDCDQDQICGCFILPHLKKILITIERI